MVLAWLITQTFHSSNCVWWSPAVRVIQVSLHIPTGEWTEWPFPYAGSADSLKCYRCGFSHAQDKKRTWLSQVWLEPQIQPWWNRYDTGDVVFPLSACRECLTQQHLKQVPSQVLWSRADKYLRRYYEVGLHDFSIWSKIAIFFCLDAQIGTFERSPFFTSTCQLQEVKFFIICHNAGIYFFRYLCSDI